MQSTYYVDCIYYRHYNTLCYTLYTTLLLIDQLLRAVILPLFSYDIDGNKRDVYRNYKLWNL